MKISIVVPIFNVEEYLVDCLDSLLNQTASSVLEVLLINDGSKDLSGQIAKSYSEKHPELFKYYEKENGGLADARNYGIQRASGEYVMFVDSDDMLDSNIIEIVMSRLKDESIDLLLFNYNRFVDKPDTEGAIKRSHSEFISKKEYLLLPPTACNKVIKTSVFLENHLEFPKGLWYEDKGLTGTYVNYVDKIFYLNEIGYHYRVRQGSITNQEKYNSKCEDIFEVMELLYHQLKGSEFNEELEYLFLDSMLAGFPIIFLEYGKKDQVKKCNKLLKTYFPNWKKNTYYKKRKRQYKVLCNLVNYNMLFLAKVVIKLKG